MVFPRVFCLGWFELLPALEEKKHVGRFSLEPLELIFGPSNFLCCNFSFPPWLQGFWASVSTSFASMRSPDTVFRSVDKGVQGPANTAGNSVWLCRKGFDVRNPNVVWCPKWLHSTCGVLRQAAWIAIPTVASAKPWTCWWIPEIVPLQPINIFARALGIKLRE